MCVFSGQFHSWNKNFLLTPHYIAASSLKIDRLLSGIQNQHFTSQFFSEISVHIDQGKKPEQSVFLCSQPSPVLNMNSEHTSIDSSALLQWSRKQIAAVIRWKESADGSQKTAYMVQISVNLMTFSYPVVPFQFSVSFVFAARRSYASAVLGVVILSVRLSHTCFVTNPKNRPAIFLYHTKGQSF